MEDDGRYEVSDDPARIDVGAAWGFLSTEASWGRWRTREDVHRQIMTAWRVVGAYTPRGDMVGFARAVSDEISMAYLADVYVLKPHRGRGIGRDLVSLMIHQEPGVRFRWLLHATDARGLYEKFGFVQPDGSLLQRNGASTP